MAEQIHRHPDRFAGFAALPLQNPVAAIAELERAVTQLGFVGALINGHTNGAYLDEHPYWGIWERAEQLGVPIYLHPADSPADQMKIYQGYPGLRSATWNWTVETATHALRIICSGIFDAFPRAIMVLGHMGEALPYVLKRIDDGWGGTPQSKHLQHLPSYYIKNNVMITTSANCSPEALNCALSAVGTDHLLFSTDYPYASMEHTTRFVETAPISEMDREKIFHVKCRALAQTAIAVQDASTLVKERKETARTLSFSLVPLYSIVVMGVLWIISRFTPSHNPFITEKQASNEHEK